MNLRTARAKLAALAVLFFLGTFAGQIRHVLDTIRGRVDAGAAVVEDFRSTVTTIDQVVNGVTSSVSGLTDGLQRQIADLQAKLAAGTATPEQVSQLQGLVERLRLTAARPGTPGAPGPQGSSGPPGPPGATSSPAPPTATTSTTAGGGPSTTRPGPGTTTTTTRPRSSSTTTTRCVAGVGRLVLIGC